ncbi:LacI family transcriptional regulator [Planosporangium flavigriseum]|uniref:substrate-binding domain-containing protein n=1 Tax=Planosporangium flavigriseum TaxID=373681 RepID=UPI001438D1A6|nr:LacI family transcriptional regulator [Planosporangium flavigriseum]
MLEVPGVDVFEQGSGDENRGASMASIADVAVAAGVSRQTVSNVFNAPHRVRKETRVRVEAAIEALGYQPNRAAQALRAQASRVIGIRIESIQADSLTTVHDRFLHALAEAVQAIDHHLLVFAADDPDDEIGTYSRLHRTGAVDAFVLYGIDEGDARPAQMLRLGAPFATFGRTGHDVDHLWVDVDDESGGAAVAQHLVARGHRRIGYIGFPEGSSVGERRVTGLRGVLDKHGLLGESAGLDLRGQDEVANGARLAAVLLDRPDPPTAVVAASDTLAVGVAQAARTRGLVIGRDLALVGFDDTPTAGVFDLSSVRQPIEAVARCIVRALLPGLPAGRSQVPACAEQSTPQPPHGRLLAPTLVVRASSAATTQGRASSTATTQGRASSTATTQGRASSAATTQGIKG